LIGDHGFACAGRAERTAVGLTIDHFAHAAFVRAAGVALFLGHGVVPVAASKQGASQRNRAQQRILHGRGKFFCIAQSFRVRQTRCAAAKEKLDERNQATATKWKQPERHWLNLQSLTNRDALRPRLARLLLNVVD